MKAVVFHDVGDIRLQDVPEPTLKGDRDAIVRLTASAICGTDLHFVRGTFPGMQPGTILGHEGVGIVEEVGSEVQAFRPGDRVVVCSTIACGACGNCRDGYFSQCDKANPNGPEAGTAFFGGPKLTGPFDGMQAEKVRVPFADVTMVRLPDSVSDDQAILLSDIFPTGWFGADMANIRPGDTVAVFGCGPVGLAAIMSAKMMGAGQVIAVDRVPDRLEKAEAIGARVINFDKDEPLKTIKDWTDEKGVDSVIDAVGVDAEHPEHGLHHWGAMLTGKEAKQEKLVKQVAPKRNPDGELWQPGQAPSQVLEWAVAAVRKAGTISIIGVYPQAMETFPLGMAMNKNLRLNMGNCNHRKYVPDLVAKVASGELDPSLILSRHAHLEGAIDAFEHFDQREEGWTKVELVPTPASELV
ncbi:MULTISPECIES: zinc-dependent alcohol dehydrogenase [Asticcacaulis]|uniref:zinc-dependent alcohol dehydrogenase n=1 Tax=Asticcacaulis TaxID=76890 RepID=UPI001AE2A398|nr:MULTISPECIES: zinc-dependent alcohol dehydrogenase [Asticcacaulis]MBP2161340.1 threonine dehydrogenase-like Zn-dependent dehydrogenase [Asticcacaulis solisilvae]MDR6802294.1 threonine dehydrogenase-like Zn-dependent dehydrogenase [Asticcacaulis sp. BE141]